MKKLLLIFIILSAFQGVKAQTDSIFWFVAPRAARGHGHLPIEFRISSSSQEPVDVKISMPANSEFEPIEKTIDPLSFETVNLSQFVDIVVNTVPDTKKDNGLLIETSGLVTVYYEICSRNTTIEQDGGTTVSSNNPEIFVLKGQNALGTEFYIPGQTEFNNAPYNAPSARNVFDILATEDSTIVEVTPTKPLEGDYPAGVTFSITLNRGQSWSGVAAGNTAADHITGTHVKSDKPITITVSDDSVTWGGGHDMIGDQIIPINILGTKYIAIRGEQKKPTNINITQDKERVYITATQANTKIILSHKEDAITIANAGETIGIDFIKDNILVDNILIESDKPIYAYQLTAFYHNDYFYSAEFGAALLPNVMCTGSTKVAYTRSYNRGSWKGQKLYLNICIPTDGIDGFTLNGNADVIKAEDFIPVNPLPEKSSSDWYYAKIEIDTSLVKYSSIMTIENKVPFHAGIFDGSSDGASYGYFSNFNLSLVPNGIADITKGNSLFTCAGETVSFFVENASIVQTIQWMGPNGQIIEPDSDNPNKITITNVTKADEGEYRVTGKTRQGCDIEPVSMHLTVYESKVEVEVLHSICGMPGSIKLEAIEGTPGYKINWHVSNGAVEIEESEFENTFEINELSEGTYYFTITDNKGCETKDSVIINSLAEKPEVSYEIESYELELPNAEAIFHNTTNNLEGKACKWYFGDGAIEENCDEVVKHKYTEEGCYEPYLLIYNIDFPECYDSLTVSDCIEVRTEKGIENINFSNKIRITPNPAKEYIKVELEDIEFIDELIISDVSGKVIKTKTNFFGGLVNIAELTSGIYVVTCKIEEYVHSQKLIVE